MEFAEIEQNMQEAVRILQVSVQFLAEKCPYCVHAEKSITENPCACCSGWNNRTTQNNFERK